MKHQRQAQRQGGRFLATIKQQLVKAAKPGISFEAIDRLAERLLLKTGGEPSFKRVPGYYWSTCINVNAGIVHGIPTSSQKFKSGDLVTIDTGLYFQGFHTDTSTSFVIGRATPEQELFLSAGRATLASALKAATAGAKIWDISQAIQTGIESAGYNVVRDLTGHGVGRQLHEEPAITCYTQGPREASPTISKGQALAIEVMYTMGDWHLVTAPDGWTISTVDGSPSAVFEETVIVTHHAPEVITAIS